LALVGGGLIVLAFVSWALIALVDWTSEPDHALAPGGSAQVRQGPGTEERKAQTEEKKVTPRNEKEPDKGNPGPREEKEGPKSEIPPDFAPVNFGSEVPPRLVAQLGHSFNVSSLALSGDGRWLVTGSMEGSARLWDLPTGKEVRVFRASLGVY